MEKQEEARLLRIFVSSTDKFKNMPLYEVIVFAARRNGIAGATVIKGFMGYGVSSIVHSQKFWELTDKVPMIIEIVDSTEKIDAFMDVILPYFDSLPKGGLITMEKATIILHKTGKMK